MRRLPLHGLAPALVGMAMACGQAPAAPGPFRPSGAGPSGSGESQVALDSQPQPRADAGGAAEPTGPAKGPDGADAGRDPSGEPAKEPGYEIAGCTESSFAGCDYLRIAAVDPVRELCIQLSLDSCSDYGGGLGAEVPLSWRLGSGSVTRRPEECEPGEFYVQSVSIASANGNLTWSEERRQPIDVVIDLTIETSRLSANAAQVPDTFDFSTTALKGPIAPCEN